MTAKYLAFGHIYILAIGGATTGAERAPQGAVASGRRRGPDAPSDRTATRGREPRLGDDR